MAKLLFVDDDYELNTINSKYFSNNGHNVQTASNGNECLNLLRSYQPDCIMLDVMMPELDGYQVGRIIKSSRQIPIIYISGKSSIDDKVKALSLGGDDYLVKPYSLKELSARIDVQLRKVSNQPNKGVITFGKLKLDYINHKAYCDNEEIHLSNREYELLHLLASQPNQLITFEEIGNSIWGYYEDQDRKTIMVNTSRLRKKLSTYKSLENIIVSVWSKGYKFISK